MYRSWDNFRILHKIDTEEAWSSSNLILKKGEIALSIQSNNSVQMKIGDGASTYSQLPFKFVDSSTVTELIKNAIPTLTGDVTSTSEYDEVSGNVKLVTSVVDNSHNHTISNITSLQDELDKKGEHMTSKTANVIIIVCSTITVIFTALTWLGIKP